jgi:uroporphyrinogen III methyltransferase / synthase
MLDPLRDRRVLVLRPASAGERLSDLLRARGAEPVNIPAIEIVPTDPSAIDRALAESDRFGWAVFTSATGARLVAQRTTGPLPFARIAAIGTATATAIEATNAAVAFMPSAYTTERLADELPGPACDVVVFRARVADDRLDTRLRERAFDVTRVDAYDTRPIAGERVAHALDGVDAVVLTAASIAFAVPADIPPRTLVCCIGPATATAARRRGIRVDIEAAEHTMDGVISALADAFGSRAVG